MTDLTEQWKKGELPEGYYYIKNNKKIEIDEYIQWYKDHGIPSEKSFAYFNVQQVLAPVPTFDEWQAKLEENAQLKELLQECRDEISNDMDYSEYNECGKLRLLKQIDEVLND